MLWLIFAILTLVIVAILASPFLKKSKGEEPLRVDYDIVVYRNQLAEIEQEIERGLLTDTQADAARAEVHRRMLAAEDAELETPVKPVPVDSWRARLAVVVAIALILPVGAIVVYGNLGSPRLPGMPYAWRQKHDPEFVVASTADKLSALLQNSPSVAGYKRLAEMYFTARNYEQAAVADRRAIELGASDANTWSELGESVVMSNGGAVVPEALMAFTNALGINPREERARFYIGMAESQIGNLKQAVAIWKDLAQSASPDASWLPMVRQHIAAFSKEGGFDPASVPASPPSADSMNVAITAMTRAMHLQTPGAVASNTPPAPASPPSTGDDKDTMIHAMVAKLAARMETTPNDVAGWQRLAHAYNVLGEHDKARAAIDHAVRLKPADVDGQLILAETQKASAAPGDDTPADFIATLRKVLTLDPANEQALYYVGLAEQKAGHREKAREMWSKALAEAPADDPIANEIRIQIGNTPMKPKTD